MPYGVSISNTRVHKMCIIITDNTKVNTGVLPFSVQINHENKKRLHTTISGLFLIFLAIAKSLVQVKIFCHAVCNSIFDNWSFFNNPVNHMLELFAFFCKTICRIASTYFSRAELKSIIRGYISITGIMMLNILSRHYMRIQVL